MNIDNNLLSIAKNSGWLIFDRLIRLVFGIFVSGWVARYLGPTNFGELAYVMAYIAIFGSVVSVGLDGIVVREITDNKISAGLILGTAFTLRFIFGLISWLMAVLFMTAFYGIDSREVILTALIGTSLIFQAADTIDLWFQSKSQSRRTVLAKITTYILSNLLKIFFIINKASIIAFAAITIFDGIILSLALLFAYKNYSCHDQWRVSVKVAIQFLRESWAFALSGLSIIIYMRIDQIMIKEMLGVRELGVYAAVLPLATVAQFIPMILMVSLAPFVARKKAESEYAYWKSLEIIFKGFSLIGWLVCIITIVFSGYVINFLFGAQYKEGVGIVVLYVFTNLSINVGVAQTLWILNEKKSHISFYKTIIGAVICIVGNLVLLPLIGLYGAALTAVISMSFSAIFSNIFFSKRILKIQLQSLSLTWLLNTKVKPF